MGETLSMVIPFTLQENRAACVLEVPMIREFMAVECPS